MCQHIQCPNLPSIMNGKIKASSMQLNSLAHVDCDEGFWVEGDDTLVCGIDAQWKGNAGCTGAI